MLRRRLLPLLAVVALAAPALAFAQNRIEAVHVVSESTHEVVLDVDYTYAADHGDKVFMAAYARTDGQASGYTGYRPGAVQAGRGRTRVALVAAEAAPAVFTTNALLVQMYVGGGQPFASAEYTLPKAWLRPQAALPPLVRLLDGAGGTLPASVGSAGAPTDVVARRFSPDGSVELVLRDGTIKRKYRGGFTVISPGGGRMSAQFVSAQPPTPPAAPPDEQQRAWVEDESARLLAVMRALVGKDEATLQNYLAREPADLSDYGRISARTEAIQWMVAP
jgi:hypothetical protein